MIVKVREWNPRAEEWVTVEREVNLGLPAGPVSYPPGSGERRAQAGRAQAVLLYGTQDLEWLRTVQRWAPRRVKR